MDNPINSLSDFQKSREEYERLAAVLAPYNEPLRQRALDAHFTTEEENFVNAYVFWHAAILEGDIFGQMEDAIAMRRNLEACGLNGTIAVVDQLLPLYREIQQAERPGEFWQEHMPEIKRIEGLAEPSSDYVRILLDYAQRHLDRDPAFPPAQQS